METRKLSGLLRGRVVSDLEGDSDRAELRFSDGSALAIESGTRGLVMTLREAREFGTSYSGNRPTARQREYLEFIRKYIARYSFGPAESDIRDHFMVSPPSAHLMVKTLERRGFIKRERDVYGNVVPRSMRVLID